MSSANNATEHKNKVADTASENVRVLPKQRKMPCGPG